jgi:hypothetical protein
MSHTDRVNKISVMVSGMALLATLFAGSPANADDVISTIKAQPSIPVSVRGPVGPIITTPKGAVAFEFSFGLAGGAEGAYGMLKKYKVRNPILTVRDEFLKGVKADPGLSNFRIHADYLGRKEAKRKNLKNTFKEPYVLHFDPGMWQIIYFLGNWKKYWSQYIASAQLIRTSDGKKIWSGNCVVKKKNKKTAPTLDELKANANNVFSNWANESGPECAGQLLEKFRKDNA